MPSEKGKQKAEGGWADLFKKEDWLAVWLGFLIIALILLGVQVKLPGFKWTTDGEFTKLIATMTPVVDSVTKGAGEKQEAYLLAAATGLKAAMGTGDRKAVGDAAKKLGEVGKKAKDSGLKSRADTVSKELVAPAGQLPGKVFGGENLWRAIFIGIGFLVLTSIGIALMGAPLGKFIVAFPVVYILAWLSMFIAGNYSVSYWGLEFVLWALSWACSSATSWGFPRS